AVRHGACAVRDRAHAVADGGRAKTLRDGARWVLERVKPIRDVGAAQRADLAAMKEGPSDAAAERIRVDASDHNRVRAVALGRRLDLLDEPAPDVGRSYGHHVFEIEQRKADRQTALVGDG